MATDFLYKILDDSQRAAARAAQEAPTSDDCDALLNRISADVDPHLPAYANIIGMVTRSLMLGETASGDEQGSRPRSWNELSTRFSEPTLYAKLVVGYRALCPGHENGLTPEQSSELDGRLKGQAAGISEMVRAYIEEKIGTVGEQLQR